MKILFILPETKGGGIATYYSQMIPELQKRGINCKVMALANDAGNLFSEVTLLNLKQAGIRKLSIIPFLPQYYGLMNNAYTTRNLLCETLKDDYDIIETTDYAFNFFPFLIYNHNIPVVIRTAGSTGQVEFHEKRSGWELQTSIIRMVENTIMSRANGIIAISKINQQYWQSSLNREIVYIPPTFKFRDIYSSKTGAYGLVLGRVQLWKGPQVLCEAIKRISKNISEIYWVGGDNYFREYSQSMSDWLAAKYPNTWGSKVIPKGRLPYDEAQDRLLKAKFVIIPSTWDTYNFTAVEAMGKGKVIIISDGAGASMHIKDGVNGFLFENNNALDLAQKIELVDSLPEDKLKEIGYNAYKSIKSDLSPEKVIPNRIAYYKRLITEFKPHIYHDDWLEVLEEVSDSKVGIVKGLNQQPIEFLWKYLFNRIKNKICN